MVATKFLAVLGTDLLRLAQKHETLRSSGPFAVRSSVHTGLSEVLRRYDVNEYAASVKVYAVKPA